MMQFLVDLYARIFLGCIIVPVGIFLFAGLGNNKVKKIITYFLCIAIMLAFGFIGGSSIFLMVCTVIVGIFSAFILAKVCFDCIREKLDNCYDIPFTKKEYKENTKKENSNYNIYFIIYTLLFILELAVYSVYGFIGTELTEKLVAASYVLMIIILGVFILMWCLKKSAILLKIYVLLYVLFCISALVLRTYFPIGLSIHYSEVKAVLDFCSGIYFLYFYNQN